MANKKKKEIRPGDLIKLKPKSSLSGKESPGFIKLTAHRSSYSVLRRDEKFDATFSIYTFSDGSWVYYYHDSSPLLYLGATNIRFNIREVKLYWLFLLGTQVYKHRINGSFKTINDVFYSVS